MMILPNIVPKLTDRQSPVAAPGFLSDGNTNSAPTGASSWASSRYGRNSGKIGTIRVALPAWCSVLGE
ncbi:MAG: hypothetical protein NTZ32_00380 [Planctomycetales bacterium]|nr:hypothetical protein [Planctomycetales bacterium]